MRSSFVWSAVVSAALSSIGLTGCRSTRPEVPPPPHFAYDGPKPAGKGVGFGSAPRAGYMTDASTQIAPGIAAPGGDRTSVASRDGLRESPTATIPPVEPPRSGIGNLFQGITSSAGGQRDESVTRSAQELSTPPAVPLDPPVALPPPPLIPPPAATSEPVAAPERGPATVAPPALPPESALPPLIPETAP